jgi:nitrite reductase/ring-hydroxylating ferredoxin subunit/uncharacterized membrane protein
MKRDFTEVFENVFINSGLVKGLANPVYDLLNKWFQETPLRPLKLFLNGSWLEHPLHTVLTDVPVGAWTVAILLELLALVLNIQGLGLASGLAIALGVLAALGAILAGLMDFMDVDPPEKAVGFVHGLANTVATILLAIAFVMLWRSNWVIDGANFGVALVGYLLLTFGAYLGGSLVYRMGVMVNRNAYRSGPKDFTPALALSDLPDNQLKRVEVKGQPVLLLRRGDRVYAIGAVCSHYGGPLEKGKLMSKTVQCPWHYSRFSLDDGSVKEGPTTAPVPAYDVQVANGQIQVRLKRS